MKTSIQLPVSTLPFDQLICALRPNLDRFAFKFTQNRENADDLVQETFLRALRYADLYKDGTNLCGWLYTIMRNTFINNYRSMVRKREVVSTHEDLSSFHMRESASGNLGENTFIQEDLNRAIGSLTEQYSVPFLRYFEGYKYEEIAIELQIPIGTVKTRIHIARKIMKASLKMHRPEYRND